MAKCEKCSAEISEGLTLCQQCAGQQQASSTPWSRPGAVANSGNSYVEVVQEEVAPAAPVAPADEPSQEVQQTAAPTNSELDRRIRQTEFFNTVSGAEEEHIEADIDDLYPPTSLLEVPFRDTEYNLGYNIPKMKMVISKKARRKILFGSMLVSAVAILIAGFITLESIFGFLPHVVNTPVLYVKSNNLYLTDTNGKRPEHFSLEGNAYSLAINAQRIEFSPYSEDVFVVKDYNTSLDNYSLYIRREMQVSSQGNLINNDIHGDFKYMQKGKAIIYLKGTSSYDLWIYNIDNAESTRVAYGVTKFALLDSKRVAILKSSGEVGIVDVTRPTKESYVQVAQDVEQVYFDEEECASFFYVKDLRNTETGEMVSDLYRYSNDKAEKVATNVESLVAYNCAENWAYCTGDNGYTLTVADLIEDDCEQQDYEYTVGVEWGFDISMDMVLMLKRNALRKSAFSIEIPFESFALSYYKGGELTTISEYCTDVLFTGEHIDSEKLNEYGDVKQGAAIVYESFEPGKKPIVFSELTNDMLNQANLVTYITEVARKYTSTTYYTAAVKAKTTKLTYSHIKKEQISFTKKFDALYYIDYESSKSDYGDLIQVKLTDKGFSDAEPIATEATDFCLLADGTVLYVDKEKTIYAGSEALAYRTSGYTVNKAADAVAILAETIDTGSRLVIFKDRTKKAVAESVKSVCFSDDTTISFIKDYDKVAGGGDYYICKKFNTVSRIDSGVSAIVKYKY